jgi:putative DNA primase/helicase
MIPENDPNCQVGRRPASQPTAATCGTIAEFRYVDAGHAETFAKQNHNFAYTAATGWRQWTGTHWENKLAESALWDEVKTHLIKTAQWAIQEEKFDVVKFCKPSKSLVSGIIVHLTHMLECTEDNFQPEPHLLNCKNGIVDLRNGNLIEHDHRLGFTWCIDTSYRPGAKCAEWERVISSTFPSIHQNVTASVKGELAATSTPSPVASYMQKCLGYSITGETRDECMFYIKGEARSGKGTILNTLAAILGESVSDGISFSTLEGSKGDPQNFRLAKLSNVRYLVASESRQEGRLDEALLKQLTGRDQITAAHKGKDVFTFTPKFKLWLMSNYAINGRYDDAAFWGRFKLFVVTGESHLGKEDTKLKGRLMEKGSREGILAWLVNGAVRYYAEGLQDAPDVMKFDLKQQREEKDVEGAWIRDCLVDDPDAKTSSDDLFANYQTWCNDNGIEKRKSKVAIGLALKKRGYPSERSKTPEGKKVTFNKGIRIDL